MRFLVLVTHVGSVHLFCGGSSKVNNAFFVFSFFLQQSINVRGTTSEQNSSMRKCFSRLSQALTWMEEIEKGNELGLNLYLNASTKYISALKKDVFVVSSKDK